MPSASALTLAELAAEPWLRFEGVMRVSHVYVNKKYMKTYSDG